MLILPTPLLNFFFQVRHLRFEEEVEKRRVLEDALHVLATEHHALECSIGAHEVRRYLHFRIILKIKSTEL